MGQWIPALPFTMGKSQSVQGGPSQQPLAPQQEPRTTQQKLQRLAELSPFQGGQARPSMQGFVPPQQPLMVGQQPVGQPAQQPPMSFQAGQPVQGSGQQLMAIAPQQPNVPAPFQQQPNVQAPFQPPIIQAPIQQPIVQAPPMYVAPSQPSTMGTKQAHMLPGQGPGFPAVDRPLLMQPTVKEGEL